MSAIGRLVVGRDIGEAILIGDDIAVVFTKDKAGTNNQGIRLMIIAPKGVLIGRTPGPVDPQALVLAAERKQMHACRLDGGEVVDKQAQAHIQSAEAIPAQNPTSPNDDNRHPKPTTKTTHRRFRTDSFTTRSFELASRDAPT